MSEATADLAAVESDAAITGFRSASAHSTCHSSNTAGSMGSVVTGFSFASRSVSLTDRILAIVRMAPGLAY